ncbi:MAG: SDR family NAD(P)-dependent oxidoreductase [Proteobacteria bacterium]|nr:SDR family NAD(P)-dependent oxidoreductase [Pseudomonadota bacterium]
MFSRGHSSVICFVWQPSDLNAATLEIDKTGTARIVVDLSGCSVDDFQDSDHLIKNVDIKISLKQFFDPSTSEFIKKNNIRTIWLEYFAELLPCDFDTFVNRLESHRMLNIVTGDVKFISYFFKNTIKNTGIALKGSEASGFVGSETVLTLLSLVEELAVKYSFQPPVHIWGGAATPEATAAFLVSGIRSVVFESLHWLSESFQKKYPIATPKISQLRIDHSTLITISPKLFFRAFNKGNSLTLKEIGGNQIREGGAAAQHIADVLLSRAIHALKSDFDGTQIIAIGIEAAFAGSFRDRFGAEMITATGRFLEEIKRFVAQSSDVLKTFFSGEITKEMGIAYPFIQGGMACITDIPAFALSIAKGGGLPTIAFGMQNLTQIEEKYSRLSEEMEGNPYAINVITLAENPYREAQLSWIMKNPPPFVVISAGDPSFAVQLQKQNIQTIFVTSDVDLVQLAWSRGVKYVVCEGYEAGGHVGELSSLALTQAILEIRRKNPETNDFPRRLIVAGGIFNHMSLFRAVLLGADAVQMGTAYLATIEIISKGALCKLYQELVIDAAVGETAITGESVGLRVRSLVTPKILKLQQLEKEYAASCSNDPNTRKNIERESVGSLYRAAHSMNPITGAPLSDQECLTEGQFMSGAVAGMLSQVVSVADFHDGLARKEPRPILQKHNHVFHDPVPIVSPYLKKKERIAITGMAMVNALGNHPDEIWQSCVQMKSGVRSVPFSRWDHSRFFSKSTNSSGKTYCGVGAFISLDISRKDLGVAPHVFRTMTDSTKLTLWLAQKAVHDSGILSSDLPKDRIGVIISQNSGEMGSTVKDLSIFEAAEEIAQSLQEHLDLDHEKRAEIENIIKAGRISFDDTTLVGRLNCTAGGFICNKYGFTGPSYAVSAACATGLVALYSAIQLIKNNVLDAAIVGGCEELLRPGSYLEFSALGALAGKTFSDSVPAATCRPFDRDRDGMVLGEGGAMIVIERESLAIARKKKIYACVSGIGASNNIKGLVESVAETQQLAINASFRDTDYGPDQVDMIECHATATPTGDIEEVKALKAVYPKGGAVVLSSFKSQIGHTLGASGLNSLIRGVCAMRAGLFPPTLNYETVDSRIDLESWGFKVCKRPERWPQNVERPRRFQVNAFGFGGANYIVQVEEADWTTEQNEKDTVESDSYTGALPSEPIGVKSFRVKIKDKDYRVGSIGKNGSGEQVGKILKRYLATDGLTVNEHKKLARDGIYVANVAENFPLALMFSGQGTQYRHMGLELFESFSAIRHWMEKIAELADFDILDLLFHGNEENLRKTVWQQPSLFVLEYAIFKQLQAFGVQPAALAGHSMGELTALTAAECFSYEDGFRIISKRAACMEKAGKIAPDPGAMMAVDVPESILDELIAAEENLFYTNFNSPHQVVIGGGVKEIEEFKRRLDGLKYRSQVLPVSMAFHSPLMRIIRAELGAFLSGIDVKTPCVPVISNATRSPYPNDPDKIREIVLSHLESPVHWRSNITTIYNDFGARLFVEIGPQDTLCRLLRDIVPEAQGVHTCYPEKEAESFRRSVAALVAKGHIMLPEPPEYLDLLEEVSHQDSLGSLLKNEANIGEIIQREINLFALEGVEQYLKPAIFKAIQQEIDPSFKRQELNNYFPFGRTAIKASIGIAPSLGVSSNGMVEKPSGSVVASLSREEEIVEKVMAIIMEATGYERSELEPDMDIRHDLSIRSSRLPVIMDAAEQVFNIVIKLEEFMDVRTISDFANRVSKIIDGKGSKPPARDLDRLKDAVYAEPKRKAGSVKTAYPISRRVFRRKELFPISPQADVLSPGGHVLILTYGADDFALDVCSIFEKKYGFSVSCLKVSSDLEQPGTINLLAAGKAQQRVKDLANARSLSGVVLLTELKNVGILSPSATSFLCTGLFAVLQVLLKSSQRKFFVHISKEHERNMIADLLAEGILGMFLAAKIEYQSMHFRSLRNGMNAGAAGSLNFSFDAGMLPIEMVYEEKKIFTNALSQEPLPFSRQPLLQIGQDDVVLVSGGARGITSFVARALAVCGCRIVLIGRSEADRTGDIEDIHDIAAQPGLEIQATLDALRAAGAQAEYTRCDVTDTVQVSALIKDVKARYGRIDGIVHGAGILRDGFIQLLTLSDFQKVLDTKLSGIINLVEACDRNIRFLVGLSSITAITGNSGQANYCCANRAMAAYITALHTLNPEITVKTFWLPPVEGLGMAEDPDLKELIKIKIGENAFLDVAEMSEIICKELLFGPKGETSVAPVRQLPVVPFVVIEDVDASQGNAWYDCRTFPLLDRVVSVDLAGRTLQAERVFSEAKDLWLNDHRPFKWLSHPIISAIMIVETFVEAARLLCPDLQVKQVEKVLFSRMFECPAGQEAIAHILCRSEKDINGNAVCHVAFGRPVAQLQTEEQSRQTTYFSGRVVMTKDLEKLQLSARDVRTFSKSARPVMNKADVIQYYQECSGLNGRYRVLENISEYLERSIIGEMIYPEMNDFSPSVDGSYQYPVYVLEGLMQLVSFYAGIRDKQRRRIMVPAAIESMIVLNECAAGDKLVLTGDLQDEDTIGTTWEAKGYKDDGKVVVLVKGLRMNWLD